MDKIILKFDADEAGCTPSVRTFQDEATRQISHRILEQKTTNHDLECRPASIHYPASVAPRLAAQGWSLRNVAVASPSFVQFLQIDSISTIALTIRYECS